MSADQDDTLPFSQRTGLAPIPPQLNLGEVSDELRRLLWYAVHTDFQTCLREGYNGYYIHGRWREILRDVSVRVFKQMPDKVSYNGYDNEKRLKEVFTRSDIGVLFDFTEFLLRHAQSGSQFKSDVTAAFVDSRAAYRVIEGRTIVAVGTAEQAATFQRAIDDAERSLARGVRTHLINAGAALRKGDWSGCVRESIHAVESVAVLLAPDENTLGSALLVLERKGYLHGSLKAALSKLYGYASDEEGARHALVFSDKANIDEADALFMLGACASFVSFLISKGYSAEILSTAARHPV